MSRLVFLVLSLGLCIATAYTESHTEERSLSRLVGQQPLLFGRRGINPNMNSLFFGKRAPINSPSLNEVRAACAVLVETYERALSETEG